MCRKANKISFMAFIFEKFERKIYLYFKIIHELCMHFLKLLHLLRLDNIYECFHLII